MLEEMIEERKSEKSKTVTVDALSYLSEVLKNGLTKELIGNQVLCHICKGTTLEIITKAKSQH